VVLRDSQAAREEANTDLDHIFKHKSHSHLA